MNFYKNIYKLYGVVFFHNLIPAYVIERLFWQGRGMNVQMVVYCEIVYSVTVVLLELPSGVLADLLGRKRLLVIGAAFACLEFPMLIVAHHFWQFALMVIFAGISGACTSGTWNALLFDSLSACGRLPEFEKTLGRIRAVDFAAGTIAALSGGVLAHYCGFVQNYWISAVSTAVAFFFALRLREPPRTCGKEGKPSRFLEIFRQAFAFFAKNTDVLVLIAQVMLIAAGISYVDEFWQTYLGAVSFPVILFGLVSTGIMAVRVPGAMLAATLLKFFKAKTILIAASLLTASGILFAASSKNAYGLIGIIIACFASEIMDPVAAGYLHRRIDDAARATIDSAGSLLKRFFAILVGLLFGYISGKFSIFSGFWLLGVLCVASAALYARLDRLRRENEHIP